MLLQLLWLLPLGVAIGAVGTLIGAGGGFLLVPIMLLVYPGEHPEIITAVSLAVVFCNAASGSYAYAKMKRVDYRSALMFAAATVPGAILGAMTTQHIPRHTFNGIMGSLLFALALYLIVRPERKREIHEAHRSGHFKRHIIEADGTEHIFSFNPTIGILLSLVVGYLSSLLGIGGGIIHVPMMAHLLNFPVHIATATSHFILAITALTGTIVHIASGHLDQTVFRTVALSAGVIVGAQIGARWSNRVRGVWIIRGLAIALALVGIRVLLTAF